jgi:hypothetical protein
MKRKFFLNYRQLAAGEAPQNDSSTSSRSKSHKQTYLHDHRTRDSLVEYLDNLENE